MSDSVSQIQQAHVSQSGFAAQGRARLKEFAVVGTASAGQLDVFDTETAPVAATYAQATTVVTVTKASHGLSVGDVVGIAFDAGTGGTSSPGNYVVATVPGTGTFTIAQINSLSVSAGAVCRYVSNTGSKTEKPNRWLMSKETGAGDTFQNVFQIPNAGFIVKNNAFFSMANLATAEVFYE